MASKILPLVVAAQAIIGFTVGVCSVWSQKPRVTFEVASIKPSGDGKRHESHSSPNRIDWSNYSLADLIKRAYGLPAYQISVPAWMEDHGYDIRAKVPPPNTPERLNLMLQNLLADRFRLKFHYETHQLRSLHLVVAEGGPKFKESTAQRDTPEAVNSGATVDANGYPVFATPLRHTRTGFMPGTGKARGAFRSESMHDFAAIFLTNETEIPVIDATGLQGKYDMDLTWITKRKLQISPQAVADRPDLLPYTMDPEGEPSIFTALKRELGLELKLGKAPFQVLVVDQADRVPIGN